MNYSTKLSTKLLPIALLVSFAVNTNAMDELPETNHLVQAGGKFVTLLGNQVEEGEMAPDFKVVNDSFSPVQLSDFKKKTILISVVPSLDTGVCSLQTKRFNEEVADLPNNIVMLTISNDLPFAQKRFCKAENVDQVNVLSDAVWRDFGQKYGLLIKDMGLLTRSIFIIDEDGKVAYKELVKNISSHPEYDIALATLKALSSTEVIPANNGASNSSTQPEAIANKVKQESTAPQTEQTKQ